MTERELRSLLQKYGGHEKYLKEIKDEIKEIEGSIEGLRELKGISYDGMPKSNRIRDVTEEAAEKIVDIYESRINDVLLPRIKTIMELRQFTEILMDRLSYDERNLIEARYVYGVRWDDMPKNMHLSRRVCFRLHKSAMTKMLAP